MQANQRQKEWKYHCLHYWAECIWTSSSAAPWAEAHFHQTDLLDFYTVSSENFKYCFFFLWKGWNTTSWSYRENQFLLSFRVWLNWTHLTRPLIRLNISLPYDIYNDPKQSHIKLIINATLRKKEKWSFTWAKKVSSSRYISGVLTCGSLWTRSSCGFILILVFSSFWCCLFATSCQLQRSGEGLLMCGISVPCTSAEKQKKKTNLDKLLIRCICPKETYFLKQTQNCQTGIQTQLVWF